MMQKIDEAKKFTSLLAEHFGDELISVILFGSVARGTDKPESDIDCIVVIQKLPTGRLARRRCLEPVFERLEEMGIITPINSHLKTPQEAQKIVPLYLDLTYEALLLYDQNHFFENIIKKLKERLQKTGAVRKQWGKFHYWDLNPQGRSDKVFDVL